MKIAPERSFDTKTPLGLWWMNFLANLNLGRMWTVTLHVRLESVRMCWEWVGDSMGGDAIRRFLFERGREGDAMLLSL